MCQRRAAAKRRSLGAGEQQISIRAPADLTQAEIGELIGVSQMQVSRIVHQALAQMRLSAAA
jgi:RNA polymerase sigma-B factor